MSLPEFLAVWTLFNGTILTFLLLKLWERSLGDF
jgi:hypothetical protein